MSLFNLFRKKPQASPQLPPQREFPPYAHMAPPPYTDEGMNHIYDLLFCDAPDLYAQGRPDAAGDPVKAIVAEDVTAETLNRIAMDTTAESRIQALAYHRLRELGEHVPKGRLLGVIVERGLPGGLDVIAAYTDGSARYINHGGPMIFWERSPDGEVNGLIKDVMMAGKTVVDTATPWPEMRLCHPPADIVKVSCIASDGLYMGFGPDSDMLGLPQFAITIEAASRLLLVLMKRSADNRGAKIEGLDDAVKNL